MKLAVFLLVCLPVVFSNPVDKRFFLDTLDLTHLFDLDTLKADLQIMLDVLGADPTELACENECHNLLNSGHVLNYGCPLVCHGFQTLVHTFKLTTPPPTPAPEG